MLSEIYTAANAVSRWAGNTFVQLLVTLASTELIIVDYRTKHTNHNRNTRKANSSSSAHYWSMSNRHFAPAITYGQLSLTGRNVLIFPRLDLHLNALIAVPLITDAYILRIFGDAGICRPTNDEAHQPSIVLLAYKL